VLGQGDSQESLELLLEGLSAHERSSREAAMDALLKIMSRQKTDTAGFLGVRISEVSNGFPEIVTDAIDRLNNTDITTQLILILFLGVLASPEGVLPVLRVARDEALVDVVLETLSSMGDVAEFVIVSEWDALDADLRLLACEYFGRRSGELSSGRLLEAMNDQDIDIRVSAARALGNRRETDAMKVLVRRLEWVARKRELEQELELDALGEAISFLLEEKVDDELYRTESFELLSEKFRDAPEEVRLVIAQIFRGAVTSRDDSLVTDLFKDPCAGVRREAVKAFGKLEPEVSAASLRLALTDESPKVRVAAAEILGSLRHACSMEDLRHLASDEDVQVRAAAMRAAGRAVSGSNVSVENRDAAMSQMEGGLQDEGLVAMAVLEALQMMGGAQSVSMALHLLESPDLQLVQAALSCVGEHGTGDQVRGIVSFIAHEDWSVRVEAIRIVETRRVRDAIEPLKSLLRNEEDAYVRDAASRALTTLEE
jgi:HEAT repeat protein